VWLNDEQRMLVEENIGLVGKVIKDKVRGIKGIGIFTYEDLYQIGCVGLCKAAAAHTPGKGEFSTFAYRLIRNEIYDALEYATLRRRRELHLEQDWLPEALAGEPNVGNDMSLSRALDSTLAQTSGVTRKGIQAIKLLAEGYTNPEIGVIMGGVSYNNVTAWVARARKFLRSQPAIVEMGDAI